MFCHCYSYAYAYSYDYKYGAYCPLHSLGAASSAFALGQYHGMLGYGGGYAMPTVYQRRRLRIHRWERGFW